MNIHHRQIDQYHEPFIVAEISCNHNQNENTAHDLVAEAKACGCDAVKFQTYLPESITLEPDLLNLYETTYMSWSWLPELFDHAKHLGIIAYSTVCDEASVDVLENIDCPAYKIASFESNHLPLLYKVRETGKSVIISTGMMSFNDMNWISDRFSALNTMFLKCVSDYPAKYEDQNVRTIEGIRKEFGFEVGISDHSRGIGVSVAAVALGATMVERHFTLKRSGGVDDCVSLEPHEMYALVKECKEAWKSLGSVDYGIKGLREYKRSLYIIKDVRKGELLTSENVGILRPNKGMDAKAYYSVMNKRASADLKKGTPLHMRHYELA